MAAWGYGLLGPVEVRVDGRAVPLPGARQRLVLTVLLVDVNRMVPAGRLIDELWDAALPADPRGALRTQVSRHCRGRLLPHRSARPARRRPF